MKIKVRVINTPIKHNWENILLSKHDKTGLLESARFLPDRIYKDGELTEYKKPN